MVCLLHAVNRLMPIDVNGLKGRIGEAFVENILRRAGYKVSRLGRESQVQQLLKIGVSEFCPDFLIWKPANPRDETSNRLLNVEVKFRSDVGDFLRRFGAEFLSDVATDWADLYVIIVTDNPEPGRSCFQALDLRSYEPDTPLTTVDLHEADALGIYRSTVEEYEELVKKMFALLAAEPSRPERLRAPLEPADRGVAAPIDPRGIRARKPSL